MDFSRWNAAGLIVLKSNEITSISARVNRGMSMTTSLSVFGLFSDCHHNAKSGKSVRYVAGWALVGSVALQTLSPLQSLETLPRDTDRVQNGVGTSPHVLDAFASCPREKDILIGSHLAGIPLM